MNKSNCGDLIKYSKEMGTPEASLLLVEASLNSIISTPGACFENADISKFYLVMPFT